MKDSRFCFFLSLSCVCYTSINCVLNFIISFVYVLFHSEHGGIELNKGHMCNMTLAVVYPICFTCKLIATCICFD